MRKPLVIAAGFCTFVLVATAASGARTAGVAAHTLTATMTAKQVVTTTGKAAAVPAALARAGGTFSGTISPDNRKLSWRISYTKLGNPRLVVADIHIGKPGKFGPVLLRVCGPCKSGQSGVVKLKTGYAQELVTGDHWITLITDKYPNGAVRGQIKAR